ncbi:MAG: hypothetical protein Q9207_005345 [Kuettlingeria erythrocarpa]
MADPRWSVVIKTGCSASLVGLHKAVRALQHGDCTGAIVAGTSLIMGPATTAAMTQEGIISPEGSCKTFDAAADGFARAEAINAVYVKTLDDALRDGNPIRAIIRNTGINSDGKSQGLMTPSSDSHEALMRKVYLDAQLDPRETGFVECHGTGTPTGDPIETSAVGRVFGEAVPFEQYGLSVPVKATAWPSGRVERASINSFGIGGTNAHVVLESPDAYLPKSPLTPDPEDVTSPHLLLFSANTQESLRQNIRAHERYLERKRPTMLDMAYTLSLRREHLPFRAYTISNGISINVSPTAKMASSSPNIVIAFSGQGAQWAEMGKDLFLTNPQFSRDVESMDRVLQSLPPLSHEGKDYILAATTIHFASGAAVADVLQRHPLAELLKHEKISHINEAELAQPLCSAIQIGLVNVLRSCGVRPKAVLGHSSGEIAAAYASEAISFDAAIITAYYRGYVTKHQTLLRGMAAVGLGMGEMHAHLTPGVVVACENSPSSVTSSGDSDKLD